ncbi:MarR family transcriptional regulator [Hellea sp.]|nr:MarR family transcriptional regulator [Hellea sp.]
MINKHDDLLGSLIHDVAHLLRHDIDRRLAPHNLTRVKWLALGVIDQNHPMTQAELATEMELGNATIGRLVDRLEERGFVKRIQDPVDRRSYKLSPTESAHELLEKLESTALEFRTEALEPLSKSEITTLHQTIIKLKDSLSKKVAAFLAFILLASEKLTSGAELLGTYGSVI